MPNKNDPFLQLAAEKKPSFFIFGGSYFVRALVQDLQDLQDLHNLQDRYDLQDLDAHKDL